MTFSMLQKAIQQILPNPYTESELQEMMSLVDPNRTGQFKIQDLMHVLYDDD
jgi:hypothetical protein